MDSAWIRSEALVSKRDESKTRVLVAVADQDPYIVDHGQVTQAKFGRRRKAGSRHCSPQTTAVSSSSSPNLLSFSRYSMAPNQPNTEQSFRSNLSQFRWARGTTDDSSAAQNSASAAGGNPFSRFYNTVAGDYIPLRSTERSNEEEAWFALSRWERYVA